MPIRNLYFLGRCAMQIPAAGSKESDDKKIQWAGSSKRYFIVMSASS